MDVVHLLMSVVLTCEGSPQMPQCYFAMLAALVVSSLALTELLGLSFCTSVLPLSCHLTTYHMTLLPLLSPSCPISYQYLQNSLLLRSSDFDYVFSLYCGVTTLTVFCPWKVMSGCWPEFKTSKDRRLIRVVTPQ